jgi:hypothetical protein
MVTGNEQNTSGNFYPFLDTPSQQPNGESDASFYLQWRLFSEGLDKPAGVYSMQIVYRLIAQ